MKVDKKINLRKAPVYSEIICAKYGNPIAVDGLLQHYSRYISCFARRRVYDDYGDSEVYVDEYIRRCIETKLLEAIILKHKIR